MQFLGSVEAQMGNKPRLGLDWLFGAFGMQAPKLPIRLFLDEPSAAVDAGAKRHLWKAIADRSEGKDYNSKEASTPSWNVPAP